MLKIGVIGSVLVIVAQFILGIIVSGIVFLAFLLTVFFKKGNIKQDIVSS